MRRKFQPVNRCCMCRSTSQSINHLMLHYSFYTDFWNVFLALFGINWFMPFNISDAYTSLSSMKVRKSMWEIWIMSPTCIFCCIWNERNMRFFDGVSTPICKHKAISFLHLLSWHIPFCIKKEISLFSHDAHVTY